MQCLKIRRKFIHYIIFPRIIVDKIIHIIEHEINNKITCTNKSRLLNIQGLLYVEYLLPRLHWQQVHDVAGLTRRLFILRGWMRGSCCHRKSPPRELTGRATARGRRGRAPFWHLSKGPVTFCQNVRPETRASNLHWLTWSDFISGMLRTLLKHEEITCTLYVMLNFIIYERKKN